jgi:hypothetical protein
MIKLIDARGKATGIPREAVFYLIEKHLVGQSTRKNA